MKMATPEFASFRRAEFLLFHKYFIPILAIAFQAYAAPTHNVTNTNTELNTSAEPLVTSTSTSTFNTFPIALNPQSQLEGKNLQGDAIPNITSGAEHSPSTSSPYFEINNKIELDVLNHTSESVFIENITGKLPIIEEDMKEQSQSDDMLRLIDLEKHHPKNIAITFQDSDGHDGVKVTKKKQLVDKPYISTTQVPTNTHETDLDSSQEKTRSQMLNPTLKFVPKGFLGPILMEEKTFSIVHSGRVHKKHKTSIESQLEKGQLVEIIAPTVVVQDKTALPHRDIISTMVNATEAKINYQNAPSVLSTTKFQVPDAPTSTTRVPSNTIFQSTVEHIQNNQGAHFSEKQHPIEHNQQVESKISDIQVEVYESTVEPHVSSTNKENEEYFSSPLDSAVIGTGPPLVSMHQERFTQYVIDHADLSTAQSNIAPTPAVPGKPEPAAIEIHINVSESLGNDSEDLEFSYRQSEFLPIKVPTQTRNISVNPIKEIKQETKNNNADSEELLVVEIIDTGENNTENSASFENFNVNPIFSISSDNINEMPLNNMKPLAEVSHVRENVSDDLFTPDVRKAGVKLPQSTMSTPKNLISDRDSDTIFYISNTEVKVGESLPTVNTYSEQQLRKSQLESQFFPVNFLTSTHPSEKKLDERQQYQEEILLSPIHNTANAMKIIRSQNENAPPLDVTYVGESVIEVEQLSAGSIATSTSASTSSTGPDFIIQSAFLPEISIGVPIIGELPPQIELKGVEYLPNEFNQHLSVHENGETETLGNEVDKIMESSIQYGGDLIDEGGVIEGGGFDGVEASYPFNNPANIHLNPRNDADFSHTIVDPGVNNLNRNELIADVAALIEMSVDNATLKELLLKNGTYFGGNGTVFMTERNNNATEFTVTESRSPTTDVNFNINDIQTLIFACIATLLPLLVAVFFVFGLRYFYQKYQSNTIEGDDSTNQLANGKSGEGDDHDEPTVQQSQIKSLSTNGVCFETGAKSRSDSSQNNFAHNSVFFENTLSEFSVLNGPTRNTNAAPIQLGSIPSSYSGPNGSITTMTLKNNHLIVETEERNDISRDARVTKMHYNTADKNGVFVVEVSRGVDSQTNSSNNLDSHSSPRLLSNEAVSIPSFLVELRKNHGEVQIHQPPQERNNFKGSEDLKTGVLQQIEEVEEPVVIPNYTVLHDDRNNANTGLSQSDLSSTSSADSNKQYSYGNQELYTEEHPFHSVDLSKFKSSLQAAAEEAQDDDHKSENGYKLERTKNQCPNEDGEISQSINNGNSNGIESKLCAGESNGGGLQKSDEKSIAQMIIEEDKISETMQYPTQMTKSDKIANAENCNFKDTGRNFDIEGNGYDSIMSLPDPPSTEEIKQLNNLNIIEANQLDSLPPPSPPPPLLNNDTSDLHDVSKHNGNLYQIESLKPHKNPPELTQLTDIRSNLPIPLTPPTSPEIFNKGIILSNSVPVAIDVNGS